MANVQVESSWLLTVRRGTTECIMVIFFMSMQAFYMADITKTKI